MISRRLMLVFFASLICAITGCATIPHGSSLPEGVEISKVAKIDAGTPFAVSTKGTIALVRQDAVHLVDLKGNELRMLTQESPALLSFSPDGERLAVAGPSRDRTRLRLYDLQGKLIGEITTRGKITSLSWRREHELLATVLELKRFSFGSELTSLLYRWNGKEAPATAVLKDITVRPMVAKWPEEMLLATLSASVSPSGEEIVYKYLKDPPMFTPYLAVVIRDIETGKEREIAQAPVESGGPLYASDKSIFLGNGQTISRWISPFSAKDLATIPTPGIGPALSTSGYALLDGRLYRNGKEVTSFPQETRGAFLPDGRRLLLRYRDGLYMVSGLAAP